MEKRADLLARLTRNVAATRADAPLSLRLCQALTEVLHLDGSAMTVGFTQPSRVILCATDEVAERIEELQDLLHEGPSLDAYQLHRAVCALPPDLGSNWPVLAQSLPPHLDPVRLIALPMRPTSEVLGVISLYQRDPGHGSIDLTEAQFLADAIGVAVLGGFERSESTEELWPIRDRLDQATGMVVAQLHIPPTDALAVLRAHAFAHDTTLADVAGSILSRELDFRTDIDDDNDHAGRQ